jgi:hypothetical protein
MAQSNNKGTIDPRTPIEQLPTFMTELEVRGYLRAGVLCHTNFCENTACVSAVVSGCLASASLCRRAAKTARA